MSLASSVALQPGEGHSLSFWGQDLTFKVRGQDTGGVYAIFEFSLPPHLPAPPLHLHTNCDECVHILEGVLKLQLDGREVVLGPGGFAVAFKGTVHTLWNGGDVPVRVMTTLSPRPPWRGTSVSWPNWPPACHQGHRRETG